MLQWVNKRLKFSFFGSCLVTVGEGAEKSICSCEPTLQTMGDIDHLVQYTLIHKSGGTTEASQEILEFACG